MRGFFKRKGFKITLGVAVVLIAVTVAAGLIGSWVSPQSSIVGAITTPLQRMAAAVSNGISDFFEAQRQVEALEKENNELRERIQEMTSSLIDYDQYKLDNEFYSEFLGIKEAHPDYQFQPATVISRDPANAFHSFTIDRGTLDGISPRSPVITADGLVGYISEAGPSFSTVITVVDPSLKVGAMDSRTRDLGMVAGGVSSSYGSQCRMSYLSRSASVSVGDFIITSGSGGIFPQGLLIGTVSELGRETTDISMYAVIQPVVDFDSLRDVMVITSFDTKGGLASGEGE